LRSHLIVFRGEGEFCPKQSSFCTEYDQATLSDMVFVTFQSWLETTSSGSKER
jgi:hypothetical protein